MTEHDAIDKVTAERHQANEPGREQANEPGREQANEQASERGKAPGREPGNAPESELERPQEHAAHERQELPTGPATGGADTAGSVAAPQPPAQTVPETGPAADRQAAAENTAPLAEQLAAARAEAAARHDDWLRALAEIENLRKRGARERDEAVRRAREAVLVEFLNVVDDVERAIDAISRTDAPADNPDYAGLRQGVELIHTRLIEVLAGFDVHPVECAGEAFDPHQHEAVMRDASTDLDPDHITRVMQKGYRIGQRILRPARVAVSS